MLRYAEGKISGHETQRFYLIYQHVPSPDEGIDTLNEEKKTVLV